MNTVGNNIFIMSKCWASLSPRQRPAINWITWDDWLYEGTKEGEVLTKRDSNVLTATVLISCAAASAGHTATEKESCGLFLSSEEVAESTLRPPGHCNDSNLYTIPLRGNTATSTNGKVLGKKTWSSSDNLFFVVILFSICLFGGGAGGCVKGLSSMLAKCGQEPNHSLS